MCIRSKVLKELQTGGMTDEAIATCCGDSDICCSYCSNVNNVKKDIFMPDVHTGDPIKP